MDAARSIVCPPTALCADDLSHVSPLASLDHIEGPGTPRPITVAHDR